MTQVVSFQIATVQSWLAVTRLASGEKLVLRTGAVCSQSWAYGCNGEMDVGSVQTCHKRAVPSAEADARRMGGRGENESERIQSR